jgi:hypothetical protein
MYNWNDKDVTAYLVMATLALGLISLVIPMPVWFILAPLWILPAFVASIALVVLISTGRKTWKISKS